jgi:high-affinity iron transporter
MVRNLFSIPIFLIVFRETLEAAIIVSVLLGLAKQIVHDDRFSVTTSASADSTAERDKNEEAGSVPSAIVDGPLQRRRLLRKLRIQVRAPSVPS